MPVVVVLDTSLSMLRRPFPEANFTYFSVAQNLIESFVGYVRRHHFTELMALVTASSRPKVRASFSRRDGYKTLLEEVMSVGVEDKANYVRAITVAHNDALNAFGAVGVPIDIVFFTDEGSLIHGIPEVPEQIEDGKPVEGLPFRFPGNLFFVSIQGTAKNTTDLRTPFERLVALNSGRGRVVRHQCAPTLPECVATDLWPRLLPPHYGELRCGWLRADVQAHPAIQEFQSQRFTVRVAGFLTPEEVSSPPVMSRHLLLPVIPKDSAIENGVSGKSNDPESKAEEDIELWYPCGTTEDDWKAPQFTALLHGSLASRHMLALAELLPYTGPIVTASAIQPDERRYALLHSELASPTASKRSNLTLSILPPGQDGVPWMGQFLYLAPYADFDQAPSGEVFPVKRLEPRAYAARSGHVCWLWGNMALDVSKVLKHARRLAGAQDGSTNSVNRVNAFYADVNRVRGAALAFGASSLLVSLKAMLEREATSIQDANTRRHIKHVVEHLMLSFDRMKQIPILGPDEK